MKKKFNENLCVLIYLSDGVCYSDLTGLEYVTDKDRTAAERYVKDEDKVLHLVSAYFKRKYIGEWTLTENGKPISQNKFFNVSHCDGAVVFVLADADVGIDVERLRGVSEDLKRYVSSDKEFASILTSEDFFDVWTAKESLVKAEGSGIKKRPQEIPSFPINGVKEFSGEKYFSRRMRYSNFIISVTKKGEEPFDFDIKEEKL